MGLTFAIGFFVAFIIKLITNNDLLDFYSSHQQELLRLRHKFRPKMELMLHTSMHGNIFSNDTREDYSRGVDREKRKPRAITTE